MQKPIADLARRHGVEIVISEHDHDDERTKPIDGTTYVVSGSAGAPIHAVETEWFTAASRTEPHFVLLDVDHETISRQAVNLRREVFDSVVIGDNPPAEGPLAQRSKR